MRIAPLARLLALLSAAGGCAREEKPAIVVSLWASGDLPALYQFRATFDNGGRLDTRFFPSSRRTMPIELPSSFSVGVPTSRSGALDVSVEGMDENGGTVAGGWVRVNIVPGRVVEGTVWLASWVTPPPDGDGGTSDAGSEGDATAPEDAGDDAGEDDATVD